MTNLSQPEKTNEDAFYFHEAYVVWEIAFNEALSMQQNPGFVHLAGACLYRLRDFDLTLAKELGVTVYHIRNWAMENLPPPTRLPADMRAKSISNTRSKEGPTRCLSARSSSAIMHRKSLSRTMFILRVRV